MQVQLQSSVTVPFGDGKLAMVSHPVMWIHTFTVLLKNNCGFAVKLAAMMKKLEGIKSGCWGNIFIITFLFKNRIYQDSGNFFSQIYTPAKAVQPHGDSVPITLHHDVCYLALCARPALAVYWKGKNLKCIKLFTFVFSFLKILFKIQLRLF